MEAEVIIKNIYMSETSGTVLLNGKPVVGARVVRKVTRPLVLAEGKPYEDEVVTDAEGKFWLPEVAGNTWFFRPQLLSANPFSFQEIRLFINERNYLIWTFNRSFFNPEFKESGAGNPDITCEIAGAELLERTGTYFPTCDVKGGIND